MAILALSCNNDDDSNLTNLVYDCGTPNELSVSNTTHNSTIINWTDTNDYPYDNLSTFIIEYGESGFSLGTGTEITVTISHSNNGSLELIGLTPNTDYDVYVKRICSTENRSMYSEILSFTTKPPLVIPEFLPNLSELNLFIGDLNNLNPSPYAFEYKLNTSLYTDYALKQRLLVLPYGETMSYNGDGLPNYPDNTLIAKTFYYNLDNNNESAGKTIIETRILIKIEGEWQTGNYIWNDSQTDAVLDENGYTIPISWIDNQGITNNIDYEIPSNQDCFTCHQSYGQITPIGPKLRSMNFNINGINQLQSLINNNMLSGLTSPQEVGLLPNWEDNTLSDETRVRAYFDMNCAHCHTDGGFHNENYYDAMDLKFETSFEDSNIYDKRYSILSRMLTNIEGYSMPYIGTTQPHQEALDLIIPYLESLE